MDHEGWASEEDRDYRGYGWDYDSDWASPGESPPRGDRAVGERGIVHGGKKRSRGTEDLPSGGGIGEGRGLYPLGHPPLSHKLRDVGDGEALDSFCSELSLKRSPRITSLPGVTPCTADVCV